MKTWQNGVSRLALTVVVASLIAPLAARADDVSGTTGQALATGHTYNILTGTTLSNTGAAAMTSATTSPLPGIVINNYGTISSSDDRGIDISGGGAGERNLTLNNFTGAVISSANDAFRINAAIGSGTVTINNAGLMESSTGQVFDLSGNDSATGTVLINNAATGVIRADGNDAIQPGSGTTIITNSGLIDSTASNNRAINVDLDDLSSVTALKIVNNAGGVIQSQDDAVRVTADTLPTTSTSQFIVDNAGRMSSTGGRAISFGDIASGTTAIINRAGGEISSSGDDAIKLGAGAITVSNSGLISSTASGGRGVNLDTPDLANVTSFELVNTATGVIQSSDDAVRITGDSVPSTSSTHFVVDNAGTIVSTVDGQAIDFDDIAAGQVTIINRASGVIRSTDADAIRPGEGATVTNYGLIYAGGPLTESNDGIDWQGHSGTVINKSGGTISGQRHGITSDVNVNVTNEAGGTIIGRNGSGVGSDGAGTVVNYGRITGAYNGSGTGDGDGVDLDLAGTVTNYGIIEGTGAAGYDKGLRLNASEGISIGGGTITNYGLISGANSGIVVNNDAVGNVDRSGVAATTIVNYAGATIIGQNGYAIRLENKSTTTPSINNDTIVNYGTIIGNGSIPDPNAVVLLSDGSVDVNSSGTLNGVTYTGTGSARFIRGDGSAIQMGEGDDVLTNYGTIIGNTGRAINLEGGNDTLNVMKGSRIVGLVDGGVGTDTLNYNKVGLTEAKRAALQAGQTVNIGGTLYTSFETVTGTAQSFASFANANTQSIANLFDNLPATASSLGVVSLLDSVASADNVGAALSQLTPAAYQSLGRMALNDATQTTSLIGQHLTDNRMNGLGTDVSGAGNALAMFDSGMFDRNFGGDRALAAVMAFPGSAGSSLADAGWGSDVADAMAYAPYTKAPAGRLPVALSADHGFFVTSGASFAREGARADAPAFRSTTVNVLAGYDQRLSDRIVAGVFGGYAFTRGDIDGNGSSAKIGTGTIGGYGTYQAPGWFATLMGLYGFSDYTTSRTALGTVNNASFGGNHFAIRGSVGTDIRVRGWVVTPEIGLQYTRVSTDGFTEAGSAAALIVGADTSESLRSSVGARFAYDYAWDGRVLTPELRFAWLHEFSDGVRGINASFADTTLPGSFVTATAGGLRDRGVLGAGLSGKLAPLTVLSVNYDAIVGGSDTVTHQVMARIKHAF